ncbi:MAG: type II toxin-antitoxin system RelE/ParE family toxin [Bacteroidota bacterium]
MGYKLILKRLAEQDITEAAEWYYTQETHLTSRFLEEIDKAMKLLQDNPEQYQKRYNEVRVLFTKNFPFGIYYTIDFNLVFVHAVLHTKRDPKSGTERT